MKSRLMFGLMLSSRAIASLTLLSAFIACASPDIGHRDQPAAEYDHKTGRLQRLVFDSNDDGRNDAAGVMNGARVSRIEFDTNGNGAVDRWDFYDADGRLARIGVSRQDDGVMDAVGLYGPDQQLQQFEVSTSRDGRFDRVEFYESGLLGRVEEDTDGDGRVDKWESYRRNPLARPGEPPWVVSMVAFDDASVGRPTRWLVYGPGGTVTTVETNASSGGTFADSHLESR